MNFTDQYIKMCDCDEVQNNRRDECDIWEEGDLYIRFFNKPSLNKYDNMNYFGPEILIWDDVVNDFPVDCIFIPPQHHIQSWIFQYGSCQYKLLTDFYDWCKEYRKTDIKMVKGCTLEELWLMFYMWRDHYKIWDGEKWIKE